MRCRPRHRSGTSPRTLTPHLPPCPNSPSRNRSPRPPDSRHQRHHCQNLCQLPWLTPPTASPLPSSPAALRQNHLNATRGGKYIVSTRPRRHTPHTPPHDRQTPASPPAPPTPSPHDRLRITFTDGRSLILNDTRKFARPASAPPSTNHLVTLVPNLSNPPSPPPPSAKASSTANAPSNSTPRPNHNCRHPPTAASTPTIPLRCRHPRTPPRNPQQR